MNKTKSLFLILVVCAFGIQTAFAQPTCEAPRAISEITADLTGLASWDGIFSPNNVQITVCNPDMASAQVSHVSWSGIVVNTEGISWCSEARIAINGIVGIQVNTTTAPGSPCASEDDSNVDISSFNIFADADGCVVLELYESFDDVAGAIDANYAAGTFTMAGCGAPLVPTLGEWAIISLGLLMLIFGVVYLTQKQMALQHS